MTKKEYMEKRTALLNEMQTLIDGGKFEALKAKKAEVEALDASWEQTKNAIADMNALRDTAVVESISANVAHLDNAGSAGTILDQSSKEYHNAFLLHLAGRDGEMTQLENAAFTHTTTTAGQVMPTQMVDAIWDLISEENPILGDVTVYRSGTVLEVVKHTAIAAGDAKTVAEGTANDDEKNTFVKVTLSGKDFSKTVKVSYALDRMSMGAFEQYLINEISSRIGSAIAADIVAQIETDMTGGNKMQSAAVKKTTYEELATVFAKLKRAKNVNVYATRATIYNYLVALVDTTGRPIFQQNAQEGAEGVLLGAKVKVEDAVADNKLLIGDPTKVVYNMVQDIMIEKDRDISTHNIIHSGYARGSGALIDADAFAELTIKQA